MKSLFTRTLIISPLFAFSLSAESLQAPATGVAGKTIPVTYSGDGEQGDRMTIGDAKGIELPGTNPADLSGDKEGTIDLLLPETAGDYTILFVANDGVVASEPIRVLVEEPPIDGEQIASPTTELETPVAATIEIPLEVTAGLRFEVNWTGPTAPRDRLVVVDPSAANPLEPISYTYLDPLNNRAVLSAPAEAGPHQIVYINGAGQILATQDLEVQPAGEVAEWGGLIVQGVRTEEVSGSSAVEVILDASGSMLQDMDGEDRIDIAKETLLKTMENGLSPGTPFALRAFGHIEEGSCESELLIPLSPLDPVGMAPIVNEIEAINLAKTPIADALKQVPSDLSGMTGDQMVILITDGKESCDGNPAEVIRDLRRNNPLMRVNIVGYSIADPEIRNDFESWAAIGGGRYFDAPETLQLEGAFQRAFAIPYNVYSKTERLVATGVSGEDAESLPPGDYTVAFRYNGQDLIKPVRVSSGEPTRLTIP